MALAGHAFLFAWEGASHRVMAVTVTVPTSRRSRREYPSSVATIALRRCPVKYVDLRTVNQRGRRDAEGAETHCSI